MRTEKRGPITTWVLDRAKQRNAVDRATAEELAAAVRAFEADETARVAVLYGDHGVFCAGADLAAMGRGDPNRVALDGDAPMGPSRMVPEKPVIAAIEGHAVAGGLELALFCDLRVAADDAILGVFCRRWGVPLIDGGTVRLPRIVGLGRALDLILTGRAVTASEANLIGLVDRVVAPGTARDAAERLAEQIASFPWTCVVNDRRSAYEGLDLDFAAAMRRETELGMQTLASPELADGVMRFLAGKGRGGSFE